jgi:hypothetical protein
MSTFRIYKYPLAVTDCQQIEMPVGAKVLHADMQNGRLCLWAMVDVAAPMGQRVFFVIGTGHDFGGLSADQHIATVQDGALVWHVFGMEHRK